MKLLALVAFTLVAFLTIGLTQRLIGAGTIDESSAQNTSPAVSVASVEPAPSTTRLTLPGTLRAWQNTSLYARAEGYLLRLHADIGDEVQAGQVLAEIDTPDLDQDLAAARAQAAQAEVQLALAQNTDRRYQALLAEQSVSAMQADQSATALRASLAEVELARARVNRLDQLTRFKRVTAPFAGRITQRLVDPGTLVSPSTLLFQLAAIDRLRVHVQVPQSHMRAVAPGLSATLAVNEFPDQTFDGQVTRVSGSLDAARTMTAEIELPNPGRRLMPGTYSQVSFTAAAAAHAVLIPANSLIVNQFGTQVASIQSGNIVKLLSVRAGRDLGMHIEVLEGLDVGAQVVTNPADTLVDGTRVRVRRSRCEVRASLHRQAGEQRKIEMFYIGG